MRGAALADEAATGHFGIDQLEKEPGRVLEIAEAVGIETIYCPYLMPDQRPDSGAIDTKATVALFVRTRRRRHEMPRALVVRCVAVRTVGAACSRIRLVQLVTPA